MNIQTIAIQDAIFSGRHGAAPREQETVQSFSVNVSLAFDATAAISSDQLSDTIDYFDVVRVIRNQIEGESCHLLETLVDRAARDLAIHFPCTCAHVSLRKIQIPYMPAINVQHNYFSGRGTIAMKSFQDIHASLVQTGGASTPFLSNDEREKLLAIAKTHEYVRQPEVTASGIVHEDLSSCTIKGEDTMFASIADRVALFIHELGVVTKSFSEGLPKADVALQKYDAGSFGITPHRDEKKYGIAICIIPLVGQGTLAICDDRAGSNPRPLDTTPGNLVMLRAPGYAGMHVRPMHIVMDIPNERIVLGIRFATNI